MVKGYYRMIDQPDDAAVTLEHILQPHREQTVRRLQDQRTVLCIQDGTDLDYNGLAEFYESDCQEQTPAFLMTQSFFSGQSALVCSETRPCGASDGVGQSSSAWFPLAGGASRIRTGRVPSAGVARTRTMVLSETRQSRPSAFSGSARGPKV